MHPHRVSDICEIRTEIRHSPPTRPAGARPPPPLISPNQPPRTGGGYGASPRRPPRPRPSPRRPPPTHASNQTAPMRITYLGHASVLIELDGLKVITDPLLRPRILGALKRVAPAAGPEHLAGIDLVLLSHAHRDHLDAGSLRMLDGEPPVLGPAPVLPIARSAGLPGEVLEVGSSTRHGAVTVEAVHADHDGRRMPWSRDGRALGFVLRGRPARSTSPATPGSSRAWRSSAGSTRRCCRSPGWGPRLPAGHMGPEEAAEAVASDRTAAGDPDPLGHATGGSRCGSAGAAREPARRFCDQVGELVARRRGRCCSRRAGRSRSSPRPRRRRRPGRAPRASRGRSGGRPRRRPPPRRARRVGRGEHERDSSACRPCRRASRPAPRRRRPRRCPPRSLLLTSDVGAVREAVGAANVAGGVRAERRERVLALRPRRRSSRLTPAGAEHDRAVALGVARARSRSLGCSRSVVDQAPGRAPRSARASAGRARAGTRSARGSPTPSPRPRAAAPSRPACSRRLVGRRARRRRARRRSPRSRGVTGVWSRVELGQPGARGRRSPRRCRRSPRVGARRRRSLLDQLLERLAVALQEGAPCDWPWSERTTSR